MLAYVIRRIGYGVLVVFGVLLFLFLLFFTVTTPDDVARKALGERVPPAVIEQWKANHGYDKQLFPGPGAWTDNMLVDHYWRMLTFDFGRSDADDVPILDRIKSGMGPSLMLTLPLFVLSLVVALGRRRPFSCGRRRGLARKMHTLPLRALHGRAALRALWRRCWLLCQHNPPALHPLNLVKGVGEIVEDRARPHLVVLSPRARSPRFERRLEFLAIGAPITKRGITLQHLPERLGYPAGLVLEGFGRSVGRLIRDSRLLRLHRLRFPVSKPTGVPSLAASPLPVPACLRLQ